MVCLGFSLFFYLLLFSTTRFRITIGKHPGMWLGYSLWLTGSFQTASDKVLLALCVVLVLYLVPSEVERFEFTFLFSFSYQCLHMTNGNVQMLHSIFTKFFCFLFQRSQTIYDGYSLSSLRAFLRNLEWLAEHSSAQGLRTVSGR